MVRQRAGSDPLTCARQKKKKAGRVEWLATGGEHLCVSWSGAL
jgi:hypothetical protein